MRLKIPGIGCRPGTKTRPGSRPIWLAKLFIAFALSNVFFYLLFSGSSEPQGPSTGIPEGWVEVQLNAELLTPFQSGKKILLVHRAGRKKLEGVLQDSATQEPGKLTVLVKESEAHSLFQHPHWEVLPYLKHLSFVAPPKDSGHEIRY